MFGMSAKIRYPGCRCQFMYSCRNKTWPVSSKNHFCAIKMPAMWNKKQCNNNIYWCPTLSLSLWPTLWARPPLDSHVNFFRCLHHQKIYGHIIFFWKCQNLAISGLMSQCNWSLRPRESLWPFKVQYPQFFLCCKVFCDLYKNVMSNWQMGNEFISVFGCQNLISCSSTTKFCLLHPNTQDNNMQLTPELQP